MGPHSRIVRNMAKPRLAPQKSARPLLTVAPALLDNVVFVGCAYPGIKATELEDVLRNHGKEIASVELLSRRLPFGGSSYVSFLAINGRQLLGFAVTERPTAEWLACQITEAFPWDTAPKYLIRWAEFGGCH
jgi:hypothetical protein